MWAVLPLALLLSMAGPAAAARIVHRSELGTAAEEAAPENRERWCLAEEATPSCEEGTVIDVHSAFTSAAWRRQCPVPPAREEVGCDPNVTEQVISACQGEQQCALLPTAPLSCSDNKQYSIRIVWGCVRGTPRTAEGKNLPAKATVVETPADLACDGSFEAEVLSQDGKPVTVCRNSGSGQIVAKACCEETISKLQQAMDACQAVAHEHCKHDPAAFERERTRYAEVPAGYVCRQMYACSLPGKTTGYLPAVKDCGDVAGVSRRACVPEKMQGAGKVAQEPAPQGVATKAGDQCADANTATKFRLSKAKGVSESLAQRIVRARTCLLKDVSDLREKLKAQQHPDGLWEFDRIVAPLFSSEPPKLCVGCERGPEGAKPSSAQSVVDVNVASFPQLTSVEGVEEAMARRIIHARSCFFRDHVDFEERFRSKPGNSNLWRFVQDAIDAGELCLKELPKAEESEDGAEESVAEARAESAEGEEDSQEQRVEVSMEVHKVDGEAATRPETRERVAAAVKESVVAVIGQDFLPSQVACGVPLGPVADVARVVIVVVCRVDVAFMTMAGEVQSQLQSQELAVTVAGRVDADGEVPKVANVQAGRQKVEAEPVLEESSEDDIKAAFWKLMGACGTTREDFVGFEHRPDWQVLPFTSKICMAKGCREAMAEFSKKHSRACKPTATICREAALWVSELYRGSADCRDLTMAQKMQEDLRKPVAACADDACAARCLQALRDFPGLARGCRSEGCAGAYAQLEAMYDGAASCPQPQAGSTFPLPVISSGLVQIGYGDQCAFTPATGGWTMTAREPAHCSYFKPLSKDGHDFGKLVDPRTNLCLGWLHKDGQPLKYLEPGVNGLAMAQCNMQLTEQGDRFSEGYDFHTVWKSAGGEICLVSEDRIMSKWCFATRIAAQESVDRQKTGPVFAARGWTFPLREARHPNLYRFAANNLCLVVPPNSGWGMGSADELYCSYFQPVEIETYNPLLRKFKDPRSGLCIGWIHHDGYPGDWIIPGINGPAVAPCLVDGMDRIGYNMDFNTVFQQIPQHDRVCIVTNQHELTPFCFNLV